MDVYLTKEGRKQLAQQDLKFSYYSFTDSSAIYDLSTVISSSEYDQTDRFILEAGNLPQDSITFEANDSGKLVGFPMSGSSGYSFLEGQIYQNVSGTHNLITNDDFSSLAGTILFSSSINAFKNQYILKSPVISDNKPRQFIVGPGTFESQPVEFTITDTQPFDKSELFEAKIEQIESFYQDKKLSHLPNFQFLPPVNKSRVGETKRVKLGNYVNIGQKPIKTYKEVYTSELKYFEKHGFSKTINFTETSDDNNLVCQFFEVKDNEIQKLDVIDFGDFPDSKTSGKTKHVFFVGKVFIDGYNNKTFVNMFTLVFAS
jgi:hypothetical protein